MKTLTIICGHYGCGKTNLTLNLAMEAARRGEHVTVVDLDVVNPYFRSCEYAELLHQEGVRLLAPVFANTTLDAPALSPEIRSIFTGEMGTVFIDAGGDDAGITALGGMAREFSECGYRMIYVINRYRVLSQTAVESVKLLREIERASRLTATCLINNSHLGVDTTVETLVEALPFAKEVEELTRLPLLYSTAPDFVFPPGERLPDGFVGVKRYVKFPWE